MCPAPGKICLKWPKKGQEVVFPTNPDLANILGRMDMQIQGCQLEIAGAELRGGSAVALDRKVVRSKELGQCRENPISASPVWGTAHTPGRNMTY